MFVQGVNPAYGHSVQFCLAHCTLFTHTAQTSKHIVSISRPNLLFLSLSEVISY